MDAFMDYLHENAEKMNSELYKELNAKILAVNTEVKEAKAQTKLYRVTLERFEYHGIIKDEDDDDVLRPIIEKIEIILPENRIVAHFNYDDDKNKFNLEECRKYIGRCVKYEYNGCNSHSNIPGRCPRLLYELNDLDNYQYYNEKANIGFQIPYVPWRLLDIEPLDN